MPIEIAISVRDTTDDEPRSWRGMYDRRELFAAVLSESARDKFRQVIIEQVERLAIETLESK